MDRTVCPGCGARLSKGVEHCDLCGAPQKWTRSTSDDSAVDDSAATAAEATSKSRLPEERGDAPKTGSRSVGAAAFCNACGWENPPDSNFCSQCGSRLQDASAETRQDVERRATRIRPPEVRSAESSKGEIDGPLARHIAVVIGLAVLVVVALYMVTVISKQRPASPADASVAAPAATRAASVIQEHEAMPVSERHQLRVDSLRMAIESEDADEALSARHQLVEFFIGIGRIDRAAIEQMRLAEASQELADLKMSGDLLSDWMEISEPDLKPQIAILTIEAYNRVLEQQPDDLETRADLGWAYQYDPQNPMEAIRQTNLVLEEDADHLMANYNKGVFLMRINRLDQALKQFERVKILAGTESPYYRQADMWIVTIRETQAERGAG